MIEPQPYFTPLTGTVTSPEGKRRHDEVEASRVAAAEQMEYDRALGRPPMPQPVLPVIKEPIVFQDFADQVAALDQKIFARGVPVNADKLLSLGRARFQTLLELDRKARSWQKIADFTRFDSVQDGLQAFEAASVPRRKSSEEASGDGQEKDQVRPIHDWSDLWKTGEREELLNDVYCFHDGFESLCLAHDMVEHLSKDGRARSRFFAGRQTPATKYLDDWLSVIGPLSRVTLAQPIWSIVSWLADETSEAPTPASVAQDCFNVRAPNDKQLRTAQAVLDGFLLDYDGWYLWEFFGRATRTIREVDTLSAWRARLAKRFPRIAQFHVELRAQFRSVHGYGAEYHHKFEPAQHRAFFDRMIENRFDCASALLALGIDEVAHGAIVARFENSVLVDTKIKLANKRATIARQLQAAFPSSAFQLEFKEVA